MYSFEAQQSQDTSEASGECLVYTHLLGPLEINWNVSYTKDTV